MLKMITGSGSGIKDIFTVKSGYRVMMSNSSSTTLNYQLAFWNHIWSLQVPAKVRSLLWRASTSSLPTLLALRSKNVDVSVMCPV